MQPDYLCKAQPSAAMQGLRKILRQHQCRSKTAMLTTAILRVGSRQILMTGLRLEHGTRTRTHTLISIKHCCNYCAHSVCVLVLRYLRGGFGSSSWDTFKFTICVRDLDTKIENVKLTFELQHQHLYIIIIISKNHKTALIDYFLDRNFKNIIEYIT